MNLSIFNRKYLSITLSAIILAIAYIMLLDSIVTPWLDEMGTADTAINFHLFNKWESNVWNYTYNPLHGFLLTIWVSLFGISHTSVCGMNVVLALISFFVLESWMSKRKWFQSRIVQYSFFLLFWLGCYAICHNMLRGRIDQLTMLFSVCLMLSLLREEESLRTYSYIFFSSLFLMFSCFYIIPVFVIVALAGLIILPERKEWFKRCTIVAAGFSIGFFFVCVFYYNIGFLYHYLGTLFSFNANINTKSTPFVSRLISAYYVNKMDLSLIFLFLLTWILLLINIRFQRKEKYFLIYALAFITVLPALMTAIGRFYGPYKWIPALPLICFLTYLIAKTSQKWLKYFSFATIIGLSLLRIGLDYSKIQTNQSEKKEMQKFLSDNQNKFSLSKNVFFRDGLLYYELINYKKNYYALFLDNINETVPTYLTELDFLDDYIEKRPHASLPKEGLMVMASTKHFKEWKEKLATQGFRLNVLAESSPYSITYFKHD